MGFSYSPRRLNAELAEDSEKKIISNIEQEILNVKVKRQRNDIS